MFYLQYLFLRIDIKFGIAFFFFKREGKLVLDTFLAIFIFSYIYLSFGACLCYPYDIKCYYLKASFRKMINVIGIVKKLQDYAYKNISMRQFISVIIFVSKPGNFGNATLMSIDQGIRRK